MDELFKKFRELEQETEPSKVMNRLIADLEKVAEAHKDNDAVVRHSEKMVASARVNTYDDFRSSLAMPIMSLVEDATQGGPAFSDIVERAKNGKYDSSVHG